MIALLRSLKLLGVTVAQVFVLWWLAPMAALAAEPSPQPNAEAPSYGPMLEGFDYPYPVSWFSFDSQQQSLRMAYMNVQPAHPNGHVAVLLHGKNFCSATWQDTIATLVQAGYRVVAPDQIGFCKSTKPLAYQYSFQQLALNTHALLASLGITQAIIVGHSTGGMLAIRYALMYPHETERLVLVDPIGLEDWRAKGVPPISIDQWYARELKVTAQSIRQYERMTYYAGHWSPSYERWVSMLAGLNRGPGKQAVAWNSALLYDMILNQPVVYEFTRIQPPTLLMIGDKDTTAIGKDAAPHEVRATLGHYPALAHEAMHAIPNATLVEFPELGHAPQIQDPGAFHRALLGWLSKPAAAADAVPAH